MPENDGVRFIGITPPTVTVEFTQDYFESMLDVLTVAAERSKAEGSPNWWFVNSLRSIGDEAGFRSKPLDNPESGSTRGRIGRHVHGETVHVHDAHDPSVVSGPKIDSPLWGHRHESDLSAPSVYNVGDVR